MSISMSKMVKKWLVKCVKKAPTLTPYIHYRFFTTFGSLNIVGLYLKNIKSHFHRFQKLPKVSKRSKKVQNGHFRVFRQSVGFLRKTLLFRTTFDLGVEKSSINRHFFMFFSLFKWFKKVISRFTRYVRLRFETINPNRFDSRFFSLLMLSSAWR